ncbi:Ubiquinone biosynthesis protein coq9, mitochondrial, partial [Kappamyces sp. JEL0680]
MALPSNVPQSITKLGQLVDDIWHLAGDRSVDLNWYSKRALLASVYTSTELFMTTDTSPDYANTMKFLDRRIADIGVIGKGFSDFSSMVAFGSSQMWSVWKSR